MKIIKKQKLPKSLKGYFWSVNFKEVDIIKDKDYIIHQILSFGNLKSIRWLFKIYGYRVIKNSFLRRPTKIYQPPIFNFIKIILDLENKQLNLNQYVINTPRNVRS